MADYIKEVDHYEVIIDAIEWRAEKEFFTEEEAVEYAKKAFECGYTVTVKEIDNVIWW